jgi:hypothetical protein
VEVEVGGGKLGEVLLLGGEFEVAGPRRDGYLLVLLAVEPLWFDRLENLDRSRDPRL